MTIKMLERLEVPAIDSLFNVNRQEGAGDSTTGRETDDGLN